ncbi:MAG: M48 family metalloprotease [Patescibacteria group bacterium]|nr:M48 family metalloprotease [Patescibacteria group bacterium]
MSLFLASIFVLGILFIFFLAIVLAILYALGVINIWLLLIGTTLLYFFYWLAAPYFSDIIFRWLYRLRWVGIEEIRRRDVEVAQFIENTCQKNKIKVPKIGFISDDNPQAFVYGSAAFNARIVFTNGIFTYLDTNERKAVFGHEIAHIVNRDFIIMTLAAYLVAMLYHLYRLALRLRPRGEGRRGRGASLILIIALTSYVFYLIGTYLLLFLSRLREYYADEKSAKWFSADALSRALVKVAYGIIAKPEEKKESEIMEATRTLGIMDFKAARGLGLSYVTCIQLKSWEPIQRTFLFDLYNPWAFLYELNSSHPLTAKRIRRLSQIGKVHAFNFDEINRYPVDRQKIYAHFLRDAFFVFLPLLAMAGSALLYLIQTGINWGILGALLIGFGLGTIGQILYRYPSETSEETDTLRLMEDVYASPIRGKKRLLNGKIVGRGIPGYIFSKDLMFQDKTGLIYLRYEGIFPFLSNLIFALFKVGKLVGKEGRADGWFFRGLAPRLELNFIKIEGREFQSWIKLWAIAAGIFLALIGLFLLHFF